MSNDRETEEIQGVTNPDLVEAIKSHFDISSKETADNLMAQLVRAKYLCAMIENNLDIKDGVAHNGSKFSIGIIEDEDGNMLLPLHTDWVHLNQSEPGKSGMVMTAHMAYEMALENYDGVVVNPSGYALPLFKSVLKNLLEGLDA